MKTLFKVMMFVFVSASIQSRAEISETTRNQKAVVRYEFEEQSGTTYNDSANTSMGAPLNLNLVSPDTSQVLWGKDASNDGYIWVKGASVIRSSSIASKIYNRCTLPTSTGLTIEAVVENNESVELRAGEYPAKISQPLRIVSMSRAFTNTGNNGSTVNVNFAFGQFYDDGNRYLGAVTTSNNNNLFSDPLMSSTTSVVIPGIGRLANSYKQKVIMTLTKGGIATLYLTDRNGNLFQALEKTTGFNGNANSYFSRWVNDAYLNVANDFIPASDIVSTLQKEDQFSKATCTDANGCANNPNRYWKGRLYRLAVYCDALTRREIFGDAYQIATNEIFPITNVRITSNLLRSADIYERLTGTRTPIYNPLLKTMESKLDISDPIGAAAIVTELPSFYNVSVKSFGAKMSNRDETINTPLNDFTATVIGAVRDNINAKQLLYENFYYQGDPTKASVPSDEIDDMLMSNNHFQALELGNFDLKAVLIKKPQKLLRMSGADNAPNLSVEDNSWASGLLTTRQWALSHMIAGTNRRAVEFTLKEFACTPIETAADSTGPEDVISRDIDRNPGGSRAKFTTSCRACHTILDGFRPAFANFTFSRGFLKHSSLVPNSLNANLNEDNSFQMRVHPDAPGVTRKMNHNEETFIDGRIVKDTKWVNNANNGANKSIFGWTKTSGTGTSDFGKAVAESKAFPFCMAKRVFFVVCKRDATIKDEPFLKKVAEEFSSPERNYNIKYLFQRLVTDESCLGGK